MTGDESTTADGAVLNSSVLSETEWAETPSDPDLSRNLGYDLRDWEVLTMSEDSDQVVYLPEDSELLRSEAFVVAQRDALCSLAEHR